MKKQVIISIFAYFLLFLILHFDSSHLMFSLQFFFRNSREIFRLEISDFSTIGKQHL
jgi:hypothetical protein